MTTWPGDPLPHPRLYVRSYRLSEDGCRLVFDGGWPDADPPGLPMRDWERWEVGEAYLALVDLDLGSSDAILDFANRFGPLNVALNDFELVQGLRALPPAQDHLPGRPDTLAPDGLYADETIEEFRYGARCIRDITAAWQWLQGNDKEPPMWESVRASFTLSERREMAEALLEPDVVDGIQRVLCEGLNWGLKPFHPFVGQPDEPAWIVGITTSLYATCCLEIYNHIAIEAPLRGCRRCRCLFVRQRGRALHGRHRLEGVTYCSLQCAQAAASKQYRARRRRRRSS